MWMWIKDSLTAIMGLFDIPTKEHMQFSIVCLLVFYTRTTDVFASITNLNDSVQYLGRYGYLDPVQDGEMQDKKSQFEALQKFQYFCGVNATGILDQSTLECLNRPRCGNRDILYSSRRKRSGRKRRFYIPVEGEDWSPTTTHLTYDIVRYTEDLTPTVVDEAVGQAFKLWSDDTVLSFERIRGGDVDIGIYFYPSFDDHGDGRPFDGPGMVLAHAFWPWSEQDTADVHLDEAETWTHQSYSGANLWLVVAHEIGHSLGLGHSFVFGSLMFPFHFGYNPSFTLHEDDINGIHELYGDVVLAVPPTPDPNAPDLCLVTMDAVMMDGYTYIFKGDFYWRILNGRPESGYPQRLSSRWAGLEGDIDAAITVKNSFVWGYKAGKTYFFKGRRVWRYNLTSLDLGFPKEVSEEFPGFPSDVFEIKGVLEISGNGETYFFTDDGFYVHSWLGFHGPYGIGVFNGIPSNIVGAMQWTDNYIYFFTDNFLYYQCSPWIFTKSRGYPRFAHFDWMGCTA